MSRRNLLLIGLASAIIIGGALVYTLVLGPKKNGPGVEPVSDVNVDVSRSEVAMQAARQELRADSSVYQVIDGYIGFIKKLGDKAEDMTEAEAFAAYTAQADKAKLAKLLAIYNKHLAKDRGFYLPLLYIENPDISDTLLAFYCADYIRITDNLLDTVLVVYPPNKDFTKQLTEPLLRFKAAVPDFKLPKVRTYVAGFPQNAIETFQSDQVFYTGDYLAFGLQYYMGPAFTYPNDIPAYVRRTFTSDHMAPNAIYAIVEQMQPALKPTNFPTLLDNMIHEGIRYYAMDVTLPDTPDSVKIAYEQPRILWLEKYQQEVWNKLIPILFEKEQSKFSKYIAPGRFTQGLSVENSPGRVAYWFGWQIVRAYMMKHPDVTLLELIKTTDYQRIFNESGYKPGT